jgi:hypothetical protein
LIFPKRLTVKLVDQKGKPLEIAGLPFELTLYESMDGFWSHRGLGFSMEPTDDSGVTAILKEELQSTFMELGRAYPMDLKTPLDKYHELMSIVMHPPSKIFKHSEGIDGKAYFSIHDYSLEGIKEDDEMIIDFTARRVGEPFLSPNDTLVRIEDIKENVYILNALSKRKRKGFYLELFGIPFHNVYDSPFFLESIRQDSGNILLDCSDTSGSNELAIYNLGSFYEIADEIGIYAKRVELTWAHVPERFRKKELVNRIEMRITETGKPKSLIESSKLLAYSKKAEEEVFETDSPAIRIKLRFDYR